MYRCFSAERVALIDHRPLVAGAAPLETVATSILLRMKPEPLVCSGSAANG